MRIGLDLNGVIFDHTLHRRIKSRLISEQYGIHIPADILCFEYAVGNRLLSAAEYRAIHNKTTHIPPAPVDEVETYLPLLAKEHDVRIVTNGGSAFAHDWLLEHGIVLPIHTLGRDESKAPYCKGLDTFVDNDLHKLRLLEGVKHRILYNGSSSGDIIAVHSWRELYERIQEMET